jgi:4-amino-4-deoxy-L-arabinose transferase-like glycosyltransferase
LIDREWREASDLRTSRLALAIVLIAGAILRFWALGHGIPYDVQIDEPEIIERALVMMRTGSLNPHGFFDYPTFYIYVQFLAACARFISGAIGGAWTSLGQVTAADFYLWGRAVTAAFGVATVMLVYQIGTRWGARHALLAAGLLAVLPLHVRYSHFALTDTPLTFFVTLTFLLSLSAHERGTLRAFAWAGAAAGLAAATKYNGGASLIMPLLACWMTVPARPSRLAAALAAIAAFAVAFLLAAPYTILDLPAFLNAFARLAGEYRTGSRLDEPELLVYLKLLQRHAFGWPALLLAAGGMGLGIVRLVRGPGRVRWALAVVFPLVYLWIISRQHLVFARYLLPMVPPLCVLAAAAVVSGVSLLRRYEIPRAPRTALIAALTIAALLPPALMSVRWDRHTGVPRTVDLAYEWIRQNVPLESSLVIESRALLLPPDKYRTRLVKQLRETDYNVWRDSGADYIIASSASYGRYFDAPERFPREYAEYMRIFGQSREVARFSPTDDVGGPELRIFKVIP